METSRKTPKQRLDELYHQWDVLNWRYNQIWYSRATMWQRQEYKSLLDYQRTNGWDTIPEPEFFVRFEQLLQDTEKTLKSLAAEISHRTEMWYYRVWWRVLKRVLPLFQLPNSLVYRFYLRRRPKTIEAVLEGFFETGTEGTIWAVEKPDSTSYDDIHFIHDGDHLTLWNEDGSVVFNGRVKEDKTIAWYSYRDEYPYSLGQQASCGLWVHWIQRGWDADEWGTLFFRREPLKARLTTLDGRLPEWWQKINYKIMRSRLRNWITWQSQPYTWKV